MGKRLDRCEAVVAGVMTEGKVTQRDAYSRVVLKISGESLGGDGDGPSLLPESFGRYADQIQTIASRGIGCGVVVGGGNIFRGRDSALWGMASDEGDITGMLATGINAMLLAGACEKRGVRTVVVSKGPCSGIGQPWTPRSVHDLVNLGSVVIVAGGLGRPGVSTDVPAVQLAVDIGADAVVMGKHGVNGVYSDDPKLVSDATFLQNLTASDALARGLSVVDREALELCRAHGQRIHIVPAKERRSLEAVALGGNCGTVIEPW